MVYSEGCMDLATEYKLILMEHNRNERRAWKWGWVYLLLLLCAGCVLTIVPIKPSASNQSPGKTSAGQVLTPSGETKQRPAEGL